MKWRKSQRLLSVILAVGMLVTVFSGCEKSSFKEIVVAEVTHSVFYAPQYVALEAGFFEEEGLDVTILGTQGADKTMSALLSKEAQIGLMGPEASIYVYKQGSKDYAISFAQVTKRDGSFLVSREKESDFSFKNLSGKEVLGGRKGGMPEMTLEYVLKKEELTLGENVAAGEVNVRTDVQFAAMAGAFTGGQGDYVSLFEPAASMLEATGEGYIVASIGEASGEMPFTAYCALESYMSVNEETIQKFTNAIYKAQQWVKTHESKEIAEIIAPQFEEMTVEELTTVVERYKEIDAWCNEPLLAEEDLNRLIDVMTLAGELETAVPYEVVVTTKFAKAIEVAD